MNHLIDRLASRQILSQEEFVQLFSQYTAETAEHAARLARAVTDRVFGRYIYLRGLIEVTNICRNDCYYCGIRCSNTNVSRYRLDDAAILSCTDEGYALGFRTFVLQGGEDPTFSCDRVCCLVQRIKVAHPDCAVTLSLGEKTREEYQRFYDAGADRYLLRHETANAAHYGRLHPQSLSFSHRMQCLCDLKQIGFQTGAGFMVGSPGQTPETLAQDFLFLHDLNPEMVGIGPFIPQHDTPFADQPAGTVADTVFCLSLLRLMLPDVLLPATTALATLSPHGRESGILAGANVVMPNLSPQTVRGKYLLYDNKAGTGLESAQQVSQLREQLSQLGFTVTTARGDSPRRTIPSH